MQKKQLKPQGPAGVTSTPAERFNLDRAAELYGDRPLHSLTDSRAFSYQEYLKNREP